MSRSHDPHVFVSAPTRSTSQCRAAAQGLCLLLLGLAAFGCRQNPHMQVYIDSVNAEKRLLEDKLYNLQDDYDAKVDELEKLRSELDEFKQGKSPADLDDAAPAPFPLIPRPRPQQNKEPEIDGLTPPTIDPGEPTGATRKSNRNGSDDQSDEIDPRLRPPALDMGTEVGSLTKQPLPKDRVVTRIEFEPLATPHANPSERSTDASLGVLLQPQNKAGQLVAEAGRATIVALDPVARSRVARWELDANQIKTAIAQSASTHGIELELPWQDDASRPKRVHIFVRYWPAHGELTESDREIDLSEPDSVAVRWTPRAPRIADNAATATPAPTSDRAAPPTDNKAPADGTSEPAHTAQAKPPVQQATRPQWHPYR